MYWGNFLEGVFFYIGVHFILHRGSFFAHHCNINDNEDNQINLCFFNIYLMLILTKI